MFATETANLERTSVAKGESDSLNAKSIELALTVIPVIAGPVVSTVIP
jgi:hypothetical protein